MIAAIILGLLLPLLGTVSGAAAVFLSKGPGKGNEGGLCGASAGIMLSASFFSLLLPGIEMSTGMLLPCLGFLAGYGSMIALEKLQPKKEALMALAITAHNFPEGMAVGAALAACLSQRCVSSAYISLCLGIALQNIPEGAILSLPYRHISPRKGFTYGALSGLAEPVGALIMLAVTASAKPLMPFILCLAAGAMLYVTLEELAPRLCGSWDHVLAALGFVLMFMLE